MSASFISALLAGGTAGIGYFLRQRSAEKARESKVEEENKRQQREAELKQAKEIFEEISNSIDALYYLIPSAMFVAVRKAKKDNTRKKQDAKIWNKYEGAMYHWMTHKNRLVALVHQYFGKESGELLKKVQKVFTDADKLVKATYYNGEKSIVKNGGEEFQAFSDFVENFDDVFVLFNKHMLYMIQNEKVGQLGKE